MCVRNMGVELMVSSGNEGGAVCPMCGADTEPRYRQGYGWKVHTQRCTNEGCTMYHPPEVVRK